jgi:hypothetical protein
VFSFLREEIQGLKNEIFANRRERRCLEQSIRRNKKLMRHLDRIVALEKDDLIKNSLGAFKETRKQILSNEKSCFRHLIKKYKILQAKNVRLHKMFDNCKMKVYIHG